MRPIPSTLDPTVLRGNAVPDAPRRPRLGPAKPIGEGRGGSSKRALPRRTVGTSMGRPGRQCPESSGAHFWRLVLKPPEFTNFYFASSNRTRRKIGGSLGTNPGFLLDTHACRVAREFEGDLRNLGATSGLLIDGTGKTESPLSVRGVNDGVQDSSRRPDGPRGEAVEIRTSKFFIGRHSTTASSGPTSTAWPASMP